MPNDTTTLNGALRQLGETMAANLTTQGVPSTYDEGLTTLAGKILDIQGGGGVRTLTLTSDKDILSYADSESATLTATLLEDGVAVSGATVEFFNGSTSLGTATTDSTGKATKSYSSQGIGDISITAKVGSLVSETYSIQDCDYYADTTKISNWNNVISDFKISSYSISLSSFSVEMKFNTINAQLMIGNQSNWLAGVSLASPYYLYTHNSSGGTVTTTLSNPVASDIWRIEVEGTTIRLYRNDNLHTTKTNCKVDYPKNLRLYPQGNSASIDYVKVKPL